MGQRKVSVRISFLGKPGLFRALVMYVLRLSSPLHGWQYFCHNVKLHGVDEAQWGLIPELFHDPVTLIGAFPPLSQQYWYSGNGPADV